MSEQSGYGATPERFTDDEIAGIQSLLGIFSPWHVVLHGAAGEDAMNVGDIEKIVDELVEARARLRNYDPIREALGKTAPCAESVTIDSAALRKLLLDIQDNAGCGDPDWSAIEPRLTYAIISLTDAAPQVPVTEAGEQDVGRHRAAELPAEAAPHYEDKRVSREDIASYFENIACAFGPEDGVSYDASTWAIMRARMVDAAQWLRSASVAPTEAIALLQQIVQAQPLTVPVLNDEVLQAGWVQSTVERAIALLSASRTARSLR